MFTKGNTAMDRLDTGRSLVSMAISGEPVVGTSAIVSSATSVGAVVSGAFCRIHLSIAK